MYPIPNPEANAGEVLESIQSLAEAGPKA
jgi:hypothetical protein